MKVLKINLLFVLAILVVPTTYIIAQRWEKVTNIPSSYLNNYWLDVYFYPSNTNYGWVCGFNGRVAFTTDGGNSWRGSTVTGAYHLESIHFPTLTIGYTSGVDGIFKSTDGGQTWVDVTPAGAADTTTFWGCYFLNENYGMVVGDGCGGRQQHFWLTTDGGNTWSVFLGSENNSGMTDVLLYPNGVGYATSSGRLWITSDSGRTWNVFSNSGPNLWQEEITNYGSSFLVPYAGTTCTGGGNDGGMRFTTDNGSTWNNFRTGTPMFGTFLIDSRKGWACGYSTEVYYTSNAGSTWVKRNCGIKSGNLDDLWFISENNGWVVGEGIYKLSNPIGMLNKTTLNFGDACIGKSKFDTLWFYNVNFNDATISLSLTGNTQEFSIVSPGSSAFVQSCDSIRIIVVFKPKNTGMRTANLDIATPFQSPISVTLQGNGVESTASFSDTLIVFDNVKCGQIYEKSVNVSIRLAGEKIISASVVSGSGAVALKNTLPMDLIKSASNPLVFSATAYDTGWTSSRFQIYLYPCDTFHFVTVKVYGKSPIILVDSALSYDFFCDLQKIYIPIKNGGNDTLRFEDLSFSPKITGLSILGWKSGKPLLSNSILPKNADTLILEVNPDFEGTISTKLIIKNNDLTTSRGRKQNVSISLKITAYISKLKLLNDTLNFGKVCVGDTSILRVIVNNYGNYSDYISSIKKSIDEFIVTANRIFPYLVAQKDSLHLYVSFMPKSIGLFVDSILLVSKECKDTLRLFVIGEGVQQKVDYLPKFIYVKVLLNTSKEEIVNLWNLANYSIDVTRLSSDIPLDSIGITFFPLTDSSITYQDSFAFRMVVFGKQRGKFTGNIKVGLEGICDVNLTIPIIVEVVDKNLVFPPIIDFGSQYCIRNDTSLSLTFSNNSTLPDTIQLITLTQKYNQFYLLGGLAFPIEIKSLADFTLQIFYTPNQLGYDTAFVNVYFEDSTRNTTIPVFAFYGESQIKSSATFIDFGEVQYCDSSITEYVNIYNLGNIPDSVVVVRGFSYSELNYILEKSSINGFDTSFLAIRLSPSFNARRLADTLIIGFLNCPQQVTIIVIGEIVVPDFSVAPSFIDLGEIWMGTSKQATVLFSNKSQENLSYILSNKSFYSLNFNDDKSFILYLNTGESKEYSFKYFGSEEGEFTDTLIFDVKGKCLYEAKVLIHYVVPKEKYDLLFKVGKYSVKPNEEVVIEIENLTPSKLLKLDSMSLELWFDRWLFYPTECLSSVFGKDISCSFYPEFSKILVKGKLLSQFIEGNLSLLQKGTALYSFPDTSSLALKNVGFFPDKPISLRTLNGFLKVSPVCPPVGNFKYELVPGFEIVFLEATTTDFTMKIKTNFDQTVVFIVSDLLGRTIEKRDLNLLQGENQISLKFAHPISTQLLLFSFQNHFSFVNLLVPNYFVR